ncbi:MAG: dienelactone hydrolase family protein [Spirochaetota bacterium]
MKVEIPLSNRSIEGFLLENAQNSPGVIFLHDLFGIQEYCMQTAEAIYAEGFTVLVPDLYSALGGMKYCIQNFFNQYFLSNDAKNNPALEEIHQIIDYFRELPSVASQRLGMVGQCLTGGFILHASIREEVKAPIVFHHSFGLQGSGMPASCAQQVKNKIQGHFVHLDLLCPPSRINKLQQQLGERLESNYYALPHGVPHFFFKNPEGKKAFQRMLQFIKDSI